MKTKLLIASVIAIILVAASFTNADAGRRHNRNRCRSARVVVVVPPVVVPKVIVPRVVVRRHPVRIIHPHRRGVYVYHAPRANRYRNHWQ